MDGRTSRHRSRLALPGPWRNADFLKLRSGQAVSRFGSQVTALALPLVAVQRLHATPAQLGLLAAAQFAPFLLVTRFAGVWVARRRRRPILIGADLGRTLLIGLIPLVAALGWLRIEHLYLVAFLAGLLIVVFALAYPSYLPTLVAPEQLLEGTSKLHVSASAAQIGGQGLAGLLVQLLSAPFALVADAVSFLASVLGLALIRRREPISGVCQMGADVGAGTGTGTGTGTGAGTGIGAGDGSLAVPSAHGLRLVFGCPELRAMLAEACTNNVFGTAVEALFMLYAVRDLALVAAVIGLILSCGSVEAVAGALVAGRAADRFGPGPTLSVAYMLACAAPALIPFAHGPSPAVAMPLVVFYLLGGVSLAVSQVFVISLRQTLTPAHLFGRMSASYRFFVSGSVPLGALFGGIVVQAVGPRAALALAPGGMLTAQPWVFGSPLPRLRRLPVSASAESLPAEESSDDYDDDDAAGEAIAERK